MKRRTLDGTFTPLEEVITDRFILKKLTTLDVELDYNAVMSSRESLRCIFEANDSWPADDMTIEDNLEDLKWHEDEFDKNSSFAYTILNPERNQCIGCLYIYPLTSVHYDASVYYWVTDDVKKNGLEEDLKIFVEKWIEKSWPLQALAYPGREIPWQEWDIIKSKKHD